MLRKATSSKLLILSALAALSTAVWNAGQYFVERKTEALVKKLENRLGVEIEIARQNVSTGEIEFQGITIGDEALTMVGAIKAKINLNPFRGPIGFAGLVEIDDLRLKLTPRHLYRIGKILQQRKLTPQSNPKTKPEPIQFEVRNATAQLISDSGKNIALIESINARSLAPEYLSFDLKNMYVLDQDLSHLDAFATLRRDQQGDWILEVRSPQFGQQSFVTANLSKVEREIELNWFLEALPEIIHKKFNLQDLIRKNLRAKGRAFLSLESGTSTVSFRSFVHARNVIIEHPLLARQAIGPINLSVKAGGTYDYQARSLHIDDGIVATRKDDQTKMLKIAYQAESLPTADSRVSTLFIDMAATPCHSLLQNIPEGLAPKLRKFSLKGGIRSSLELSIRDLDIDSLDIRAHHSHVGCKLTQVPVAFSLKKLRYSQFLSGRVGGGLTLAPLGKKTTDKITPYNLIPATLKVALVAAEDTGFWHHGGFEFASMIRAIKKNLADGEVSVGGSTISMQTAKNLFLDRERTISRKIEEVFFTWYLEKYLTKKRILEIYTNIIEYGPELYGAPKAARAIFGKDLATLNLKESLFLTTLLPSPVKRFTNACNPDMSDGFEKLMWERFYRVKGLLRRSPVELKKMMEDPLVFNTQPDQNRCQIASDAVRVALSKKSSAPKTF